jgi:hypothetical protein
MMMMIGVTFEYFNFFLSFHSLLRLFCFVYFDDLEIFFLGEGYNKKRRGFVSRHEEYMD